MFQSKGVLSLSKWELLNILSTVNSHIFVYGQPKGFIRILKQIYDDRELDGKDRAFIMSDLRLAVDENLRDFLVVPIENSMGM
jgi:prephenate dehydratase